MGCAERVNKRNREMREAKCGCGCWDEDNVCQMRCNAGDLKLSKEC